MPHIAAPRVSIGLIEKVGMHGTVKWVDGVMTLAESVSGHGVVMDGPPELGGKNHGVRPMEMLLLGTGGCALFDVITMLKKSRQ